MNPGEHAYIIEPLGKEHDRSAFTSGVEALDRYLRQLAGQEGKRHVAKTYVLSHRQSGNVAGFYTLANAAILLAELPPEHAKRLPRYPHVPATLLGRLAVDLKHRNQGLGRFLLLDAMKRALESSWVSASFALVVDAKDESARAFYLRYDFNPLAGLPNRLFLPMRVIESLFTGNNP